MAPRSRKAGATDGPTDDLTAGRGDGSGDGPGDNLAMMEERAGRLARSTVYQRVPAAVRARLDRAILLPAEKGGSVQEVCRELQLEQEYGISPTALRGYVRRLEALARPIVGAQVLAAVLGCLPAAYRRKVVDGSQTLLVSRVVQALMCEKNGLSVGEMARLASILGPSSRGRGAARRVAGGKRGPGDESDPGRLPESVRLLYGLGAGGVRE